MNILKDSLKGIWLFIKLTPISALIIILGILVIILHLIGIIPPIKWLMREVISWPMLRTLEILIPMLPGAGKKVDDSQEPFYLGDMKEVE